MSTPKKISRSDPRYQRAFDRGMLRSAFASLFWGVIAEKRRTGFTQLELAKRAGKNKSEVSRWFSGEPRNLELNTIADIAYALDLEIIVQAKERSTGRVFTPTGVQQIEQPDKPTTSTVTPSPVVLFYAERPGPIQPQRPNGTPDTVPTPAFPFRRIA